MIDSVALLVSLGLAVGVGVVLWVIDALLILLGVRGLIASRRDQAEYLTWPEVQGEVMQLLRRSRAGDNETVNPIVRYVTLDGRTLIREVWQGFGIVPQPGSILMVRYNPSDPEAVVLATDVQTGASMFSGAGLLCVALLGAVWLANLTFFS